MPCPRPPEGFGISAVGHWHPVFFFSNRLGCMGSLLLSAAVTLVLLLLLGVFD